MTADSLVSNSQDKIEEALSPRTFEFVMDNYQSVDQQRIGTTTREQTHASMMHSLGTAVGNEPAQYSAQESKVDASNKPAVCVTGVERSQDSAATFKAKKRSASMMDGGDGVTQQQEQQIYVYKPQLLQIKQQLQMQRQQQQQMQRQQQQQMRQPQMQQQQHIHLLKQEQQPQLKVMVSQDSLMQLLHSLSSGTSQLSQHNKDDTINDIIKKLIGPSSSSSTSSADEMLASILETKEEQQTKIHLQKRERQPQQKVMESQDFLMQLHPLSSGKSQLSQHNKDDNIDDVIKKLIGPSSPSSTSSADEILASILGTKAEQQTQQQTLSSSKDPSESGDEEKMKTIREIIERCDQTESRKILVHQFVLAFLVAAHCRMSSTGLPELLTFSTEDGGDTDMMSENFAVRDKEAVGRIWNKLKENQKGKYGTFSRAMRLGRERKKGYFVYLNAGKRAKKLIYQLGPKGMDDLRAWIATWEAASEGTDDWSE